VVQREVVGLGDRPDLDLHDAVHQGEVGVAGDLLGGVGGVGAHGGVGVLGGIEEEKEEVESMKSSLSSVRAREKVPKMWTNRMIGFASLVGQTAFGHIGGRLPLTQWVYRVDMGGTRDIMEGGDDMCLYILEQTTLIDYLVTNIKGEIALRYLVEVQPSLILNRDWMNTNISRTIFDVLKKDRSEYVEAYNRYKEEVMNYKHGGKGKLDFKEVGFALDRSKLSNWLTKIKFYEPLLTAFYNLWGWY